MSDARILIVCDGPTERRMLRAALVGQNFVVDDVAAGGDDMCKKLREEIHDVILLFLKSSPGSVINSCREIRAVSEVPFVIVFDLPSRRGRTEAFEAGADQCVSKSIGMDELCACIRAAKRRIDSLQRHILVLGEVEIDFETHEVRRNDRVLHLTAKESKLLRCLASRAGAVISHRRLLQAVWGPEYGNEVEYLRVFINQLRKKIEADPSRPAYILTDRSAGYRLVAPPREQGKGQPR